MYFCSLLPFNTSRKLLKKKVKKAFLKNLLNLMDMMLENFTFKFALSPLVNVVETSKFVILRCFPKWFPLPTLQHRNIETKIASSEPKNFLSLFVRLDWEVQRNLARH